MKRGDKLRQLTDPELATYFCRVIKCCPPASRQPRNECNLLMHDLCFECWMGYLTGEMKTDSNDIIHEYF